MTSPSPIRSLTLCAARCGCQLLMADAALGAGEQPREVCAVAVHDDDRRAWRRQRPPARTRHLPPSPPRASPLQPSSQPRCSESARRRARTRLLAMASASGASTANTPAAVATPLPPRNPSHTGYMWPMIDATPAATGVASPAVKRCATSNCHRSPLRHRGTSPPRRSARRSCAARSTRRRCRCRRGADRFRVAAPAETRTARSRAGTPSDGKDVFHGRRRPTMSVARHHVVEADLQVRLSTQFAAAPRMSAPSATAGSGTV